MNVYSLITRARFIAQRTWLGGPTQELLLELANELEMSITKLRDKEWAHEWAVQRRRAKELEYHRERMRKHREKLKTRK